MDLEARANQTALEGHMRDFQLKTTKSGKPISVSQRYDKDEDERRVRLQKKKREIQYVPWTFMDTTGLCSQLPDICNGGQK